MNPYHHPFSEIADRAILTATGLLWGGILTQFGYYRGVVALSVVAGAFGIVWFIVICLEGATR